MLDKNKVYYLAHLYSLDVGLKETEEEKIALLEERFDDANRIAAKFINEGYNIYSPISCFHVMALKYDMPKTFTFWSKIDFTMIDRCDGVIVCNEEGIDRSEGVQAELKHAREKNKEIFYYENERVYESDTDWNVPLENAHWPSIKDLCTIQPMTKKLGMDIFYEQYMCERASFRPER